MDVFSRGVRGADNQLIDLSFPDSELTGVREEKETKEKAYKRKLCNYVGPIA